MKTPKPKCTFCGNNKTTKFLTAKDRLSEKNEYIYLKCSKCGLIYLNKKSNNKNFQAYNLNPISKTQKLILWLFYKKLKILNKKKDILNFGCGEGNLSRYLLNKGHKVDSLEINKTYLNWLKKFHNITAITKIPNKKYDLIILKDVFEHLENPISKLKQLKNHLKTNGQIIIAIQNIDSLQAKIFKEKWFHLDAPRHIYQFPRKTFKNIIKKNNLKIIKEHYFNIDIDPTGWYWSMKKQREMKLSEQFILGIFIPLVIMTSLLKSTGEITYIIQNEKQN